jgi:hypothetical protein
MWHPSVSARISLSIAIVSVVAIVGPLPVRAQVSSALQGGSAVARTLDDRSRAELLAAREQVWRAWFGNDSAQLERLLPRDAFLAAGGPDSTWQNRDQTIAGSRAFAKSGGRLVSIEFPRTEMQVFGDVVVIYTTFRYTTERAGQRNNAAGSAVEVFVRRNGVWQNPSWYLDFRQ